MKVAPNNKFCVWNTSFRNVQDYFYMECSLWIQRIKRVNCTETITEDLFCKNKIVKLTSKSGILSL